MYGLIPGFIRSIFERSDPQEFKRSFLEALLRVQNVSRGSLWVLRGQTVECIEAAGEQSERIVGVQLPADKPSVVGWVIENARMTVAEPRNDPRHFKEIENGLAVKSSLILCFPLILLDGTVYGAVEIIDTSAGGDRMNLRPDYLELLEALVSVGAAALSRTLDLDRQAQECKGLRRALEGFTGGCTPIVGRSGAVRQAQNLAESYGRTDFAVLITGESGTGKELFAHAIHQAGRRKDKPFFVQNCSAIPESLLESELFGHRKGAFTGADRDKQGLFEAANGGTVFLDEIGDMAPPLQAKILRLIQNGELKPLGAAATLTVNVRIISATNKDLKEAIAQGQFREDLFYRLNVLPLALPALRERTQDIPDLLEYFIRRDCLRMGLAPKRVSPAALACLTAHPWRGNIRELENVVKYLLTVVEGPVIEEEHLPGHLFSDAPLPSKADMPSEASGRSALSSGSAFVESRPVGLPPAGRGPSTESSPPGQAQASVWPGGAADQPGRGLLASQARPDARPRETDREGQANDAGPAGGKSQTFGDKHPSQGRALREHTWEELEKAYIIDLLDSVKWNISKAAKLAGVNRSTFDSRLRKLGVSKG